VVRISPEVQPDASSSPSAAASAASISPAPKKMFSHSSFSIISFYSISAKHSPTPPTVTVAPKA